MIRLLSCQSVNEENEVEDGIEEMAGLEQTLSEQSTTAIVPINDSFDSATMFAQVNNNACHGHEASEEDSGQEECFEH